MKRTFLSIIMLAVACISLSAASLSSLTWANVCSGGMGADWYGSAESQKVADIVIAVQKNNGGWMKNDQLHQLSTSEYNALLNAKGAHSCLDNVATTQELRFLAKVYQGCKEDKYLLSFEKGVDMILKAQMQCGGWGQYLPRSGNGSYQDYITFNDNLMTNVMKLLRDIYNNTGDFKDLVDESTRNKCKAAFDKGLECIIKCQYDDNGTPAAWCAQHDTIDYLPTEGRPHELPSISGSESAALLSFLMTVENPSEELQNTITTAVEWLDAHAYKRNAQVQNCTNAKGESDRLVFDATNCDVWARFIQCGGESGAAVYNKLFTKLSKRGNSRSYTQNGRTYSYTEYEIAKNSYDATKEYEPIYAIYDDTYPHLYYRFLYNYEDADSITDWKGCKVPTSLNALRRTKYWFLVNDPYNIIHTEYPAWKTKIDMANAAGDATLYELSATTNTGTNTDALYNFNDGFTITNTATKAYSTGKENTVKFSAGVPYNITIPEGLAVTKVTFYGYDNYETNAYISNLNGTTYDATTYVFPAKEGATMYNVAHTIDLSSKPAVGTLPFTLGAKQCCLIITLYTVDATGVEKVYEVDAKTGVVKYIKNGVVVIEKDGKTYNAAGKQL